MWFTIYNNKMHFTCHILLTRRNALVLKVGVSNGWQLAKMCHPKVISVLAFNITAEGVLPTL